MKRRGFLTGLAAGGTVGLAGCTEEASVPNVGGRRGTPTDPPTPSGDPVSTTTDGALRFESYPATRDGAENDRLELTYLGSEQYDGDGLFVGVDRPAWETGRGILWHELDSVSDTQTVSNGDSGLVSAAALHVSSLRLDAAKVTVFVQATYDDLGDDLGTWRGPEWEPTPEPTLEPTPEA